MVGYAVIEIAADDSFKVLNMRNMVAYGSYATRAEAEEAAALHYRGREIADQLAKADPANY